MPVISTTLPSTAVPSTDPVLTSSTAPLAPRRWWVSQAPARPPLGTLLVATLTSVAALLTLVLLGQLSGHLLLVPPLAASMALIAWAPQAPLSQPRSVIGGQLVSAVLGVGVGLLSHSIWAGALAGGIAVGVTMLLRMPHSPAAGTAVIATLTETGQLSLILCVGVAACILVGFGLLGSQRRGARYPRYWI